MNQNKVLRAISTLFIFYLLLQTVVEFYREIPKVGDILGVLTTKWAIAFIGIILACLLLFIVALGAIWRPERTIAIQQACIRWRERLGGWRWLVASVLILLPVGFLLFTYWGSFFIGVHLRLLYLLGSGFLVAICMTIGKEKLIDWRIFFLGVVGIATLFNISSLLINVTNYPFSLSWSEGNRLYDYSLTVDSERYQLIGDLIRPHGARGRLILWGILFLLPDTPIWLHRLWNVFLSVVPHLTLGFLLASWSKLPRLGKYTFALWSFLFLAQGPIYTPLILCAMLVVLTVRWRKPVLTVIGVVLAGFYASASRWTWLPAPATWAGLILLSDFELKTGEKWYRVILRLLPIVGICFLGLLGGLVADPKLLSPKELSSSTALSQPLLWYRLFPNATNKQGILINLIIATAPLIALLVWMVATKRWGLNWLQKVASCAAGLAFLAMGLVASVKIGGGNNLHNLDTFFVTLAILAGLMMRNRDSFPSVEWSKLAQIWLVITLILPAWRVVQVGSPLLLPPQEQVNKALKSISTQVAMAKQTGEVLLMDERQLVTFGYLKDVPMVTEYEKKYVMDRAMAGNAAFFERFYSDLSKRRFSLIITDPLYTREKSQDVIFSEESNAWIYWVARPLLCYYQPLKTFKEVGVQLLVPKPNPVNCPGSK